MKPMSPTSLLRSALLAALCLSSLANAGSAQEPERKPVKLATLVPKGSSYHKALLAMGEKWRAGPEGGVKLTIYPDGSMGGEADMVRKMRVGQLQAAMLTVTGLEEIEKSVTALQNLPLMFRSLDEVAYVREKLRPELERKFEEKGFVCLFWGDVGWTKYFSRQPVLVPEDLKKVKLFTLPGDTHQLDLMKSLGLQPVALEPTDILTGLQTGIVDAVPITPFYAQIFQFYTGAPHMLDLEWAPLVGAGVIQKKVWDTYPPALQASMRSAAAEAGAAIVARNRAENDEAVEAMKKRGLKVHPVTPEVREQWRRWVEPIYSKLRGAEIPAETFDEAVRAIEEYRAMASGK
jgi:TRAP-type transport system periplasmic protein